MITTVEGLLASLETEGAFDITLEQLEFGRLLRQHLVEPGLLPLTSVDVQLEYGQMQIVADASLMGMVVAAHVVGWVSASDGIARFEASDVQMNGAPAPGMMRQIVLNMLNAKLASGAVPVLVDEVHHHAGAVRVVGRTKPGGAA